MKRSSLRLVMMSGDWISTNLPEKIRDKFSGAEIVSLGGATEASIWSIYHPVREEDGSLRSIPYGKPLANQKFYVLNSELELCPVGIQGELYIGGAGVALGYMNDEEKTKNSFINHSTLGYIYKTGDYGVLHRDGYIEFLGRKDHQVKIKGYRIELGEIESRLIRHPQVKNAVVIDKTDVNSKKFLCAYVVCDKNIKVSDLKGFLSGELPKYMIPSVFVFIERLPLGNNGKVDRSKLPEPEVCEVDDNEYQAPTNITEEKLIGIWQEILSGKVIGVNDDFFEFGGDSISVGKLVMEIRREFNYDIPLNVIFMYPTIKQIANYMDNNSSHMLNAPQIDNMMLLRQGSNANDNIFFIHAGSGDAGVYTELCSRMDERFNCLGISIDRPEGYGPVNNTVEEIASAYLEKIILKQPEGPYYISGWCAGGTVAFEIVRLLEQNNRKVAFLGLIDSLAPEMGLLNNESSFSVETEIRMLEQMVGDNEFVNDLKSNMNKLSGHNDVWRCFVDYLEKNNVKAKQFMGGIPPELLMLIPNAHHLDIKGLIYFVNLFRSSDMARAFYIPSGSVKAQIHFFEADNTGIANKERWNLYCEKPIKIYKTKGDHVSMMKPPDVTMLSQIYNSVLYEMYVTNIEAD